MTNSTASNDSADIIAHPDQAFGEDPTAVRDTSHYADEYVGGFVEKWDDLIDWNARFASEGPFFKDLLKKHNVKSVLDVAAGTGFHSVRMLKEGFYTVSADGSAEMLTKAFENGKQHGELLQIVQADWRWLNRDIHQLFDCVVCLGNSFTHMFSERDRRKALAEFYSVLKSDGILILDQRNYASMLDNGFSNKHEFYYCGDEVSAEPEYLDDGLARFRYTFSDGSIYHLNMFPLRTDYTRRLMRDTGFQRVTTYGDFEEDYKDDEADFLVHVAEKAYMDDSDVENYTKAEHTARDYYNSDDADNFYFNLWGGEDLHVGTYNDPNENIFDASRRTVENMCRKVSIDKDTKVLDLGAGFGGSARYLARTYGCHVTCLNVSEVENERNRRMNKEQGLDQLIEVQDGSFDEVPYNDNQFDLVWSQDAFLHSGDRARVIEEMVRVLKPGGEVVFTDPMQADNADTSGLQPILDRINLAAMGSPGFYERELKRSGAKTVEFDDVTESIANHYGRVLKELEDREDEIKDKVSQTYRDNMKAGLKHWVNGGNSGNLAWGIIHAKT